MLVTLRHRVTRGTVVAAVAATLAATSVVAVAGSAAADPEQELAEVRARVEQVSARLDALYLDAEIAHERYLRAQEDYDDAADELDRARSAVTRQEAKVEQLSSVMGSFAAAAYRQTFVDSALYLVLSDEPDKALDDSTMIDAYAEHQVRALAKVAGERTVLSRQQADVDEKTARMGVLEDDLERQKKAVDEKVLEAETLMASLEDEERALLEEIERQRQLEAQRRAEALARAARDAEREALAQQQAQQQVPQQAQQGDDQPAQQVDEPAEEGSAQQTAPPPPPPPASGRAAAAVQFALGQVGDAYVYGGTGPNGWDCSGLTSGSWAAAGVSIPRTSHGQFYGLPRVSMDALQPGDIIGYYGGVSHVGIYIGNGQIVHSSRPGRPVSVAGLYSMPVMGAVRPG